jgi:hypothetical protein
VKKFIYLTLLAIGLFVAMNPANSVFARAVAVTCENPPAIKGASNEYEACVAAVRHCQSCSTNFERKCGCYNNIPGCSTKYEDQTGAAQSCYNPRKFPDFWNLEQESYCPRMGAGDKPEERCAHLNKSKKIAGSQLSEESTDAFLKALSRGEIEILTDPSGNIRIETVDESTDK